jgi:hypothetical protein
MSNSRHTKPIRPRDPAVLSQLAERIQQHAMTGAEISARQAAIHRETLLLSRLIDRPNFFRLETDDVARMVRLYDDYFFDGHVIPTVQAEGLSFGLSSRMTRVAGKLVTHHDPKNRNGIRKFELVLSSTLLFQTFDDVNRPIVVTGFRCRNRLEAMQRIVEHEFTHLVEMLVWNEGNCSDPRFQSIAKRYFAHSDYHHDLITQRERAARRFDIRVGDKVRFASERGVLVGRINRITRRATVLVLDPRGEKFSDGTCYQRYYVPLERLTKVNEPSTK